MTDADRARGLMVGIAVGNLLGIRVEGWPRRKLEREFPDGIRDITAGFGYPDDDDLAQAIIIADAASAGGLDIDDLGRRFWHWAEVNGAGMGGLTRRALAFYGDAPPQRLARNRAAGEVRSPRGLPIAEASRQAWGGDRAGNGALMRCAPLAIRWQHDSVRLVRESLISAVPTHWDPRCGWSCAVANLAVAGSLRQETISAGDLLRLATEGVAAGMGELERYGYHEDPPASVADAVEAAWESVLEDLRFDGSDMGFTLLTLKAALISYWRAEDFESGLCRVVEAGGDTDTNGAVVGAMLGARFGSEAIPVRWRDRTSEIRAGRVPMEWYADRLIEAAGTPA